MSMKVAVECEKHSPIFGQHASWQTLCSFSSPRMARVRKYSGETGARTLIQSGCFRSTISGASCMLHLREVRHLSVAGPPSPRLVDRTGKAAELNQSPYVD